nr:MAG TPA: hypothetical protein [Caudoviricetes sp.]
MLHHCNTHTLASVNNHTLWPSNSHCRILSSARIIF